MDHIAVHRQQNLETFFGLSQQCAVFQTGPTDEWNGFDPVPGQITAQPPIEVLVQQDVHLTLGPAVPYETLPARRLPAPGARWGSLQGNRQWNRRPPDGRT